MSNTPPTMLQIGNSNSNSTASMLSYALSIVHRPGIKTPPAVVADESIQDPPENKYAAHGHTLLTLARGEPDAELSRQLYVHALIYLLRALPDDLNSIETLELAGAIPDVVLQQKLLLDQEPTALAMGSSSTSPAGSTKVEEAVTQIVRAMTTCAIVSLPLLVDLARRIAKKEQEYKISKNFFARCKSTYDCVCGSTFGAHLMSVCVGVVVAAGRGIAEGLSQKSAATSL
ncbi:uncharacterized protein V2V93DRAFT_376929 [Kockiozyma suomiensis]|uniref:uncharacterized protein n=1 Tax=Kockiozyma suomiensis TaxID=1337062 RepID=UPI0033433C6D